MKQALQKIINSRFTTIFKLDYNYPPLSGCELKNNFLGFPTTDYKKRKQLYLKDRS